jgi:hypothetical protein
VKVHLANGNIKHMVMLAHMRMFTTCQKFKDGIPRIPFPFLGLLLLVKCIMENPHKKSITIVFYFHPQYIIKKYVLKSSSITKL